MTMSERFDQMLAEVMGVRVTKVVTPERRWRALAGNVVVEPAIVDYRVETVTEAMRNEE